MEAQTSQPPSGSGPSSAAYPRSVMLEQYRNINVGDSSCSVAYDANTLVAARTSIGDLIQFSLDVAEPLSASRVCIQARDGADVVDHSHMVVAAHGDSLLIRLVEENEEYDGDDDYFVYNAGDAAADPPRPPSLSLLPLPPCRFFYSEEEKPARHPLDAHATGLLRHGDDDLVVAELRGLKVAEDKTAEMKVAELCLFRSGEWSVMRPTISYADQGLDRDIGEVWHNPSLWSTIVPLGDRQLCWVQLSRGVMICDVFEESPSLQCLQLPMDPCLCHPSIFNQNVCSTAGGAALKFIDIFPRCCCGGAGVSNCKRSHHAYTIHTWMLRIEDGGMEWVKDGIVDASELWALDAYKGLPRVPLDLPIMSMDEHEPHVIYFQLCERHHGEFGSDCTIWLVKVETRSKTIQSVSRCEEEYSYKLHSLIPSNVFHFFNSCPSNAGDGVLMGEAQMSIERQPVVDIDDEQLVTGDDASNSTLRPSLSFSENSEQSSEFFEAFLEISRYGLGDDELKAYKILSHENGRRFQSLLRLPKNQRKEWLLMEIKASQAY